MTVPPVLPTLQLKPDETLKSYDGFFTDQFVK
jgi:hypothetical protein